MVLRSAWTSLGVHNGDEETTDVGGSCGFPTQFPAQVPTAKPGAFPPPPVLFDSMASSSLPRSPAHLSVHAVHAKMQNAHTVVCADTSCEDLYTAGAKDGIYTLLNNGKEVPTYCDMTRDGGGWNLALNIDTSDGMPWPPCPLSSFYSESQELTSGGG